ncbi:hypothetical protein A0257_22835 (plasmid) [Hymenobacter psoromatis]|nr:hypothetical protein A0257_22835 [Hymenobacter psoromatis]
MLTLLPVAGWAQGYVEGASLSSEVLPLTSKDPGQASDFRAYITRASVVMPRFLRADKSQALLLGLNAEAVYFAGNRPGFDVQHLFVVTPVLGYTRQLTPALRLTGLFLPTLGSDYRRIKGEDVQFGGLVRGLYRVNPLLALGATLGFRQTFYGPTYILLGGLDWQVADKVRIFGDVPATLTASYAATPKLNAGLDVTANFGSYRLEPENHYVRYRTFIAGLFAEYYVQPRVALRATAGYSLVRNLEIYQAGDRVSGILDFVNLGTAPLPVSPPIGNGLVLRLALSFRMPTPK